MQNEDSHMITELLRPDHTSLKTEKSVDVGSEMLTDCAGVPDPLLACGLPSLAYLKNGWFRRIQHVGA